MKSEYITNAISVIILTGTILIMPFVIEFIWVGPIFDGNLVKSLLSLFVVVATLYTWLSVAEYILFGSKP